MASFSTQVHDLKQSMQLRDSGNLSQDRSALQQLVCVDQELSLAEEKLQLLRRFMEGERAQITRMQHVMDALQAQADHCEYIQTHLPARLPGADNGDSCKENANPASTKQRATSAVTTTAHSTASTTASSSSSSSTSSTSSATTASSSSSSASALASVVRIPYVRVEEFDSVPPYLRGRITRDHINSCIDAIHETLTQKYKILAMPRAGMGESTMKKYKAFKEVETADTKNLHFFIEEDLKLFTQFKLDPAGRGAIAILRHLNRLKEHRSGGVVRFIQV